MLSLVPQRLPWWAGWSLMAGLILVEFLLFRHYLRREVVWVYPQYTDQVAYLSQAYETYESMKSRGIVPTIEALPATPQGALMRVQAALFFRVAGASRQSALELNFIYFALLQCGLIGTVRWLAGRWDVAWIALGLLLSAGTPFLRAGGIADFRIDFIAFCLYGLLLCALIRSRVLADWRGAPAVGLVAAVLIGFRFIAAVYVGGALLLLGLFFVARLLSRDASKRRDGRRRLASLLLAGAIIALLVAPLLWANRTAIHDYYWVNHVTGAEKDVRAAEVGASQWAAALAYYPRSLMWEHAGIAFLALGGAMLIGAALMRFIYRASSTGGGGFQDARDPSCSLSLRERDGVRGSWRRDSDSTEGTLNPPSPQPSPGGRGGEMTTPLDDYPLALAWGAVGAFWVVPLVALTLDVSKSPVVADVMVGPLAWMVILGMLTLLRGRFPSRPTRWAVALGFAAVASIAWGVRTQAAAYSADRFMSQHRRGARAIGRLYDDLAAEARRRRWSDVGVFCNSIDDYLNGQIATVLTYERHGYLFHIGDMNATVLAIPEEEVFRDIAASQFVILCQRSAPSNSFDYPFNRELDAMRPRVEAICRRDMTEIGHYQIFGNDVRLFVRRAAPAPSP